MGQPHSRARELFGPLFRLRKEKGRLANESLLNAFNVWSLFEKLTPYTYKGYLDMNDNHWACLQSTVLTVETAQLFHQVKDGVVKFCYREIRCRKCRELHRLMADDAIRPDTIDGRARCTKHFRCWKKPVRMIGKEPVCNTHLEDHVAQWAKSKANRESALLVSICDKFLNCTVDTPSVDGVRYIRALSSSHLRTHIRYIDTKFGFTKLADGRWNSLLKEVGVRDAHKRML